MSNRLGLILGWWIGLLNLSIGIAQDSTQTKFDTKTFVLFQTNNQIDFYMSHPTLLHQSRLSNVGVAQLSFNQTNGDFKRPQEAGRATQMTFSSYGIRDVNKIRVSGSFVYEREWQNDVGLAHRFDISDPSPYYLFAQKLGNWNKINYLLSGDMTANVLKNKLRVGAGADYTARQIYRTIDPRPNINVFGFKPRVFVGHQFSESTYLGLTYKYGYGKNDVSVDYKNDLYGESLIYPEYINYLNAGFGYVLQQQTVSSGKTLKEKILENDLEMAYSHVKADKSLILLAGYKSKKQTYYRNASSSNFEFVLSSFQLNRPYLTARYNVKSATKTWLSELTFEQQEGKDFNTQLNGNNYVYTQNNLGALTGFTSQRLWEVYLKGAINTMDKADGVSNNRMKLSWSTISLAIAKAWSWSQPHILKVGMHAKLNQNLSSSLQISPVFESYAVQQIIRPEYDYLRSNSADTGLEINYLYKKTKTSSLFVRGSFNLHQNFSNYELALGKSRYVLALASGFVF